MKIWQVIATVGPVGYVPFLPGTVGALLGAVLGRELAIFSPAVRLGAIIVLAAVAVAAAGKAEKIFGKTDDQRIVIDELVGMLVAGYGAPDLFWLAAAFLLFRLFDITKILGVRACQNLPAGYGVVLDDLAAGTYANLAWRLVRGLFVL